MGTEFSTCGRGDWSRVLLQKLIITQLVKKFSSFYGAQKFITVFTRARYWSKLNVQIRGPM